MHEQGPLDAFRKSSLLGGRSADGFISQLEHKSLLSLLGLRGMAHTFLLATKDEHALTHGSIVGTLAAIFPRVLRTKIIFRGCLSSPHRSPVHMWQSGTVRR